MHSYLCMHRPKKENRTETYMTTPYAPDPTGLMNWYFLSTSKTFPETLKVWVSFACGCTGACRGTCPSMGVGSWLHERILKFLKIVEIFEILSGPKEISGKFPVFLVMESQVYGIYLEIALTVGVCSCKQIMGSPFLPMFGYRLIASKILIALCFVSPENLFKGKKPCLHETPEREAVKGGGGESVKTQWYIFIQKWYYMYIEVHIVTRYM